MLASHYLGRRLVDAWDKLLARIPFVRSIYSSVKQLLETLFSSQGQSFRNVVLVEYPRAGSWTLAFQTAADIQSLSEHFSEAMITVYVPTTPNPTSGFMLIVPKQQVIPLKISVDDALKLILSLGVVQPNRRKKLENLLGVIVRTHYAGALHAEHQGTFVHLAGWVHRRRDHGGVVFIDLRDVQGIVQVVFQPEDAAFAEVDKLRSEFVIEVEGLVRLRPEGTENPDMPTGAVEVVAQRMKILNTSKALPFQLDDTDVNAELRLQYRYLDLRSNEVQKKFHFRAECLHHLREYVRSHRFTEVETPYLTKATPEGARDYLVPSRTHPGKFFALPQSPQLFKQLLMVAGFDRYYQIVRCFRDEDLRADRQPEFTQLDMEVSFMDETSLQTIIEGMVAQLFKKMLNVEVALPLQRMTYDDAMMRYGSDKPDLRIPLEIVDISDLAAKVDFKVFQSAATSSDARVAVLKVPGHVRALSRKEIDDYSEYAQRLGAKGLAYIKVNARAEGMSGLQSPILKYLNEPMVNAVLERVDAHDGDLLFFGADRHAVVNTVLGALRLRLGQDLPLMEQGWRFLWVVDFPMFEYDERERRYASVHHPFTAPKVDSVEDLLKNPAACVSRGYDLVLNGVELGGGSVRIHRTDLQQAVFEILGIGEDQAREKFGFLLDALQFGAPPHAGIALGLDRLIMLMQECASIREVIAFPKTQAATCLMTKRLETLRPHNFKN